MEGGGRFVKPIARPLSGILIVRQLRASFAIQDREIRARAGWSNTSDSVALVRHVTKVLMAEDLIAKHTDVRWCPSRARKPDGILAAWRLGKHLGLCAGAFVSADAFCAPVIEWLYDNVDSIADGCIADDEAEFITIGVIGRDYMIRFCAAFPKFELALAQ